MAHSVTLGDRRLFSSLVGVGWFGATAGLAADLGLPPAAPTLIAFFFYIDFDWLRKGRFSIVFSLLQMLPGFLRNFPASYCGKPGGLTDFDWVLSNFFCRFLKLGLSWLLTGFLLGCTGFCQVFFRFYLFLSSLTGFYWVLLGFTGFY